MVTVIKRLMPLLAGVVLLSHVASAQVPALERSLGWSDAQYNNLISTVTQIAPQDATNLPPVGMFYSVQNPLRMPTPGNFYGLHAWDLGHRNYLLDDVDFQPQARSGRARSEAPLPPGGGTNGGGSTNGFVYTFDTNGLWLDLTNISNGIAYGNLHNATNQVYALWSTTDAMGGWRVETEIWPSNTSLTPFAVEASGRSNLFLAAQDWTGVTQGGNTVPVWWIWSYFGVTDLSDTDLDSSGNSLLYDFQNNLDPNAIYFALNTTNFYVNSSFAAVQVRISSGTPSYMAVLVDDVEYSNATWVPFNSNVVANLGGVEGWHAVSIGLKGRAPNAQQTWDSIQIKLELTPPPLVITNPMPGVVTQPFIQLQGYSASDLVGVTYDLNNSMVSLANQQAFVTGNQFDTNNFEYTNDDFECFDIPLSNGTNIVTLHATDVSGNTTVTNLTYVLDPSAGVIPPVIGVSWPQNNTAISGTNFPVWGTVSDPFATVTAQVANSAGTNSVVALVEQDGSFWIQNVPLANGVNDLTITATNAAGYGSVTNMTITQSVSALAIGSVNFNEPMSPTATVSGSSEGTGPVLVNGIQATNNGDGTWTAYYVPTGDTGTATIVADATESGVPGSADARVAEFIVKRPEVALVEYHASSTLNQVASSTSSSAQQGLQSVNWEYGFSGNAVESGCGSWAISSSQTEYGFTYIGNAWDATGNGTFAYVAANSADASICGDMSGAFTGPIDPAGVSYYIPSPADFNNVQINGPSISRHFQAQSRFVIKTGGQSTSGLQNLWLVCGSLLNEPIAVTPQIGSPPWDPYTSEALIPFTDFTIAGQPMQESDGFSIVAFNAPNNAQINITPKTSQNPYLINISATEYQPQIQVNGITLDPIKTNATFCVGQQLSFSVVFSSIYTFGQSVPLRYSNTVCTWSLPDKYVNTIIPNSPGSTIYTNLNSALTTTNGPCTCWYVNGSGGTVSVQGNMLLSDGKTIPFGAVGRFGIYTPKVNNFDYPVNQTVTLSGGELTINMLYSLQVQSDYQGLVGIMQLVNGNGQAGSASFSTENQYFLDNTLFVVPSMGNAGNPIYTNAPLTLQFQDQPGITLNHSSANPETTIFEQFEDYIVFMPAGSDNIYITLATNNWAWGGSTIFTNGQWSSPPSGFCNPPQDPVETSEFPYWPNVHYNN